MILILKTISLGCDPKCTVTVSIFFLRIFFFFAHGSFCLMRGGEYVAHSNQDQMPVSMKDFDYDYNLNFFI
jgi:hypothetical protein